MTVSDIKPWFKEDIARQIRSVYFAMKTSMAHNHMQQEAKDMQWVGALDAWSAILLAAGINPADVFDRDDINFMARMQQ